MQEKRDVVIIGAGAAGLMCALSAGARGRSVLVVEHSRRIANKVRISGGGRCNFTNLSVSGDDYVSRNPHFCKSALARFTPGDFVDMMEKHGIAYHEKEAGQLFCDRDSGEIVRILREKCSDAKVEIRTHCSVRSLTKESQHFVLKTDRGVVEAPSVVVATGGLSFPKLGATDFGHRIARQFGLNVTPLSPALVPLTWNQNDLNTFAPLSGISLDAVVGCRRAQVRGKILFTHRGLSGPAILQISLHWQEGDPLAIDLFPDGGAEELLLSAHRSRMRMETLLSRHLPDRFARTWCDLAVPAKPLNRFTGKELREIAQRLRNWRVVPDGTEGYTKAEVTLGGVDTDELSSKTMEAKKVPGLFFVGEVVDVTGCLGGFNLQWAWSSGYVAGQYV